MKSDSDNPFGLTKASHFSDKKIHELWVDFPVEGGFEKIVLPASPMPMLILGGKGSGKTHLMRHLSFNLQKLRYRNDILKGIKRERYIGIYLLGSALDDHRFSGKGQNSDVWNSFFAYYMDLYLAELTLNTITDLFAGNPELIGNQAEICKDLTGIFDSYQNRTPETISELINQIGLIRKDINIAVNNCSVTGELGNFSITQGNSEY
jgi:hypothetical protein